MRVDAAGHPISDDGSWYWNGQQWLPVQDSLPVRQAELEAQVQEMTRQGYIVTSRTESQVHLMRPKKFSAVWAILWFLVCGVGVLVYIFYWMGKRDDIVMLSRAEGSNISGTQALPPHS